ncbi:MAG: class I SAM-dependent methyltransferase [Patescibacteria group bacterium]
MKKPIKKLTFDFFDFKWKKVPSWARDTEEMYRKWYLQRYGYFTFAGLQKFLSDKNSILEAGCGLARDSKMFAELNPRAKILAMDQSPSAIKVASETLRPFKNCSVIRDDITNFKYSGTFDFISCDQALHHTPNPAQTLRHLYRYLSPNGVINFSVCRKKNEYRDFVDDAIMDRARTLKPEELWKFSEVVTRFGEALYNLNLKGVIFKNKKYETLQRFVHNQVFRCWYSPSIDFNLSVSSNFDWFSGNPRFNSGEVRKMMKKGLGPHKLLRFYEDDATISVSIKKL